MRLLALLLWGLAFSSCSYRSDKSSPSLTVMSFNIHHARAPDNRDAQSELENYLLNSGADFVFLQEVDKGTRRSLGRDQFALLQSKAQYPHGHAEYIIDWDGGLFGIALLSRHPLESVQIVKMEAPIEERGPEYEPRAAIVAKSRVNGRVLTLVATHLHYESPARESMAAQLRPALEALFSEGNAMVFGGDLNLLPGDSLLASLTAGMNEPFSQLGVSASAQRVDYLFTRDLSSLLAAKEDEPGLSDHPAYMIQFAWP